ncbi:MAG: replication factor C large subunit [Thermoplasmatota archaeon]
MQSWTEKYRPQNLDEVIGNERAINSLRNWGNLWKNKKIPKYRAVILSGKPGTGKTSSAFALANHFGWIPIELNASDARNADTIKKIATYGAVNESFDDKGQFVSSKKGGRKLIILDEADNLYERIEKSDSGSDFSDKGGKKAILDTIRVSNQPIILIVNDYYNLIKGTGAGFKQLCMVINFYDVNTFNIVELLKSICKKENITTDGKVLQVIADRCKGDVRSAVNDLQSICVNQNHIDIVLLDALGFRNREKIIFDALRDIFKTKKLKESIDDFSTIDVPPEMLLLWLSENLPREYLDIDDMAAGFEALSKADIFFGRVLRRQHYKFWSYALDMMNGGVSVAKSHNYGNTKYYPPSWMRMMGQSKTNRAIRDSIVKKISNLSHNSQKKTKEYFLPHFTFLFQKDISFACKMKKRLDFSESEIKYLLGEKYKHNFNAILNDSEKITEINDGEMNTSKQIVLKKKKDEKIEIKQPSLFDF